MFHNDNIIGDRLLDKQLCLTFDDGPGEHTLPIALFLNSLNIRATFFVVGKYAQSHLEVLGKLKELGHLVANHTYEHPDLPYYCSINGNVQDQLIRTNALIKPFVDSDYVFFRAPYGKWSPEVARELNTNPLSSTNFIGPIHWEIPGIDCHYWNLGKSVEEAKLAYLGEIEKVGKGIVVMHDEIADMDIVKPKNKTLDLIQTLIPTLLQLGYHFIGLDQIEGLLEQEIALNSFYIRSNSNDWLSSEDNRLFAANKSKRLAFKMEQHLHGKVSLTHGGKGFVACNQNQLTQVLFSEEMNQFCLFDYIPVRNNGFLLRTYNGNYLSLNPKVDKALHADAQFIRKASLFYFQAVSQNIERKVSFSERLLLFKKAALFIKSKLFSK